MNHNIIIINYNLFDLHSNIQVIKEGSIQQHSVPSNIPSIVQKVINLVYSENIFEIGVNAPEDFVTEISNRITDTDILVYSI